MNFTFAYFVILSYFVMFSYFVILSYFVMFSYFVILNEVKDLYDSINLAFYRKYPVRFTKIQNLAFSV